MATLSEIQKAIDNKTFDPNKLTPREQQAVDEAIKRGLIKGPDTGTIRRERFGAAADIAKEQTFLNDPLKAGTGVGQPTYELVGDIGGSIYPYVAMRKQIFGAAKSGNLWQKRTR